MRTISYITILLLQRLQTQRLPSMERRSSMWSWHLTPQKSLDITDGWSSNDVGFYYSGPAILILMQQANLMFYVKDQEYVELHLVLNLDVLLICGWLCSLFNDGRWPWQILRSLHNSSGMKSWWVGRVNNNRFISTVSLLLNVFLLVIIRYSCASVVCRSFVVWDSGEILKFQQSTNIRWRCCSGCPGICSSPRSWCNQR